MPSVVVVRLDSTGDVLLAGPAVRAVAAGADRVVLLAGPRGLPAARLLPGVDTVLTWQCPWVDPEPGPVLRQDVLRAADAIRAQRADQAVILTSYHQDPLPTALLLRLAGVPHITAAPEDYPGSLLDVRHRLPAGGLHEVERMLSVAQAAGFPPPADRRLRLRSPLPPVSGLPGGRYVVVHPGASVPARAPLPGHASGFVAALARDGWHVLVTGSPAERALTAAVAGEHGTDLGGQTSLAQLASVIAGAAAVVTGNTGPAHLAAAVGTPVVSLFAPTVPLERWRPWLVPAVVLGDQDAPCAGSRARQCPVPGHPCLAGITAAQVTEAVRALAGVAAVEAAGMAAG
ncbi:MAG: glycosyltransferase family 9 protein [Streptosporangiaceae bacterium]|nr:glycosyltransferase family 9 protein [Streptosporangiaceae bacterium]